MQYAFEPVAAELVCLIKSQIHAIPAKGRVSVPKANPGNRLQMWQRPEEQDTVAKAFTQFASQIEKTHDNGLASLAEPDSVVKGKLHHMSYTNWQHKLAQCAYYSPLTCVSDKIAPGRRRAKDKIEAETRMLRNLEQWHREQQERLPRTTYTSLSDAEAFAWNLWLDKLTDHVKTVSRCDGIKAAIESIVSFLFLFGLFVSSCPVRIVHK